MNGKLGLSVLRLSLGIVILIEAVMFVLPSAAHDFARTHMPGFVRLVLGCGEILGMRASADSRDGGAWSMVVACRLRDGDPASPAPWALWDWQSGDLCGGGVCNRGVEGIVRGAALPRSQWRPRKISRQARPAEMNHEHSRNHPTIREPTCLAGEFHHADHVRLAFRVLVGIALHWKHSAGSARPEAVRGRSRQGRALPRDDHARLFLPDSRAHGAHDQR